MTPRQLITYIALIFVFSWLLQMMAIVTTGDINSNAAEGWLVATMFIPLLVTVGYIIVNKDLRKELAWKPIWKRSGAFFLAFLIPTIIAFAVLAIVVGMGYGQSGWFAFTASGASISGGPFVLGLGEQSWVMFVLNMIATGAVFSLMNGIPAAGEEFAWRGFLQGQLTQRFGTLKGIALLGFIWSMWHLPAQLAGYNFPDSPVVGSFIISPLELIAVSFFLGWLTLRSGSFIPAAIAHGAGNSIQEGVISNLHLQVPEMYEHVITMGVTVVAGMVFVVLMELRPD